MTWPAPAGPDTVWRTVHPFGSRGPSLRVRQVRLWGNDVWIDETDAVLCDGCGRTVPIADLTAPGNGHRVSPWGNGQRVELWSGEKSSPVPQGVS
ncbi:MAG: hypothetical protein QM747_18275 [Nocardioides sp.]